MNRVMIHTPAEKAPAGNGSDDFAEGRGLRTQIRPNKGPVREARKVTRDR